MCPHASPPRAPFLLRGPPVVVTRGNKNQNVYFIITTLTIFLARMVRFIKTLLRILVITQLSLYLGMILHLMDLSGYVPDASMVIPRQNDFWMKNLTSDRSMASPKEQSPLRTEKVSARPVAPSITTYGTAGGRTSSSSSSSSSSYGAARGAAAAASPGRLLAGVTGAGNALAAGATGVAQPRGLRGPPSAPRGLLRHLPRDVDRDECYALTGGGEPPRATTDLLGRRGVLFNLVVVVVVLVLVLVLVDGIRSVDGSPRGPLRSSKAAAAAGRAGLGTEPQRRGPDERLWAPLLPRVPLGLPQIADKRAAPRPSVPLPLRCRDGRRGGPWAMDATGGSGCPGLPRRRAGACPVDPKQQQQQQQQQQHSSSRSPSTGRAPPHPRPPRRRRRRRHRRRRAGGAPGAERQRRQRLHQPQGQRGRASTAPPTTAARRSSRPRGNAAVLAKYDKAVRMAADPCYRECPQCGHIYPSACPCSRKC